MNNIFILSCIVSLSLTFSCRRKNIAITSLTSPKDSINADITHFIINEIDFNYFQFKSKIDVKNSKNNLNFTVHGRMKKDSIIWLSITPGLGVEALRCLITKDSILIIDRLNNQYLPFGLNYINQQFNAPIDFFMLQNMIIGNMPLPKKTEDKIIKKEELGFWIVQQTKESIILDNYINLSIRKLDSLDIINTTNKSNMTVKYTEFTPMDSVQIAKKINIIIRQKNEEKNSIMDIEYTKAERVDKQLNFPFNVPKRFENKDNK